MKEHNEKDFKEILIGVCSMINHNYKITPIVLHLWLESMRPYEFDQIKKAMSMYINSPHKCKYIPKPGDIVEIIDGSHLDNSMMAWSKVEKAVPSVGSYQSVCFDDPTINAVIQDMGGWISLCQTNQDELKFRANEFRNRYQAYKASGGPKSYPKKLYGICESENSGKGHEFKDDLVFVGNKEAAMIVHKSGTEKKSIEISIGGMKQVCFDKKLLSE